MPNETCAPDTTITLAHGAGGRKTAALIHDIFAKHFHSPYLTADVRRQFLGPIQMAVDDVQFPGTFA